MSDQDRAYGKLRDIIERHGGTMTYQRQGFRHGAWILCLNDKTVTLEAMGNKSFPELDRLYIPIRENPTDFTHYKRELVDNAEEDFLRLFA